MAGNLLFRARSYHGRNAGQNVNSPPPPPPYFGQRINDYLTNTASGLPRVTGAGGDYPLGFVDLRGGTYYLDPIDPTPGGPYARAFDGSKPFNGWLWFRELDGPGTVVIDGRPESAASYNGQTQDQAYNDSDPTTGHGGGMRFRPGRAGALRYLFDGGWFKDMSINIPPVCTFTRGRTVSGSPIFTSSDMNAHSSWVGQFLTGYSIPLGTFIVSVDSPTQLTLSANATQTVAFNSGIGDYNMFGYITSVSHLIFHRTRHTDTDWRRQWDIVRRLEGASDTGAGATIPDTAPYNSTVRYSPRFHGNNFPTCFRLEGARKIGIIGADIGPANDDGIFTGSGCDSIKIVGVRIHEIDNGNNGPGPEAWCHDDCWQFTGRITNSFIYDSTLEGLGLQWVAESENADNCHADRCWQGNSGAYGGFVAGGSGWNILSSSAVGSGAPTTRLSGHYWKCFGNGKDTGNDGVAQQATATADITFHTGLRVYPSMLGSVSATVAVPSAVTVAGSSSLMVSSVATYLSSPDTPQMLFFAAYAANELPAVQTDYGIPFD